MVMEVLDDADADGNGNCVVSLALMIDGINNGCCGVSDLAEFEEVLFPIPSIFV